MDFLTHLFLPIAVVYTLRPELFDTPLVFGLAGFAVLSDLGKIVSIPGGLHSILTLLPLVVGLLLTERLYAGEYLYSPVAVALLYSHLLLDIIDGNLVQLLAPVAEWGIGFRYPGSVVLGGRWPIVIQGELVSIAVGVPPLGYGGPGTYPFVTAYGIVSLLVFVVIVVPDYWSSG